MRKAIFGAVIFALLLAVSYFVLNIRYPHLGTVSAITYVVKRTVFLVDQIFQADTPYDDPETVNIELENIKKMILSRVPKIENASDMVKATTIRDLVYSEVPLQSPPPGFDYSDLDQSVFLHLFNDDFGDICGGLSITYMTILKAFDIPSRYVGMFRRATDAPNPVTSHASVDVYIDGHWVAMDPTFNFSIELDGRRLSWEEYRHVLKQDVSVSLSNDGYALLPDRIAQNYPVPLEQFTNYMIFGLSSIPEATVTTVPNSWDGIVRYADGTQFNQKKLLLGHGSIYMKLAKHLS